MVLKVPQVLLCKAFEDSEIRQGRDGMRGPPAAIRGEPLELP